MVNFTFGYKIKLSTKDPLGVHSINFKFFKFIRYSINIYESKHEIEIFHIHGQSTKMWVKKFEYICQRYVSFKQNKITGQAKRNLEITPLNVIQDSKKKL